MPKIDENKTRKINSILEPLRDMMSGEAYAEYLDLAEEGEAQTYSDVALLLTQYKGSMKRFNHERM